MARLFTAGDGHNILGKAILKTNCVNIDYFAFYGDASRCVLGISYVSHMNGRVKQKYLWKRQRLEILQHRCRLGRPSDAFILVELEEKLL